MKGTKRVQQLLKTKERNHQKSTAVKRKPVTKITGREALKDYPSEKASVACTPEQYREIITILWEGTTIIRKNHTVATILQVEGNTGLRIGDVMHLRLNDILYENGRYRFHIREGKTKKLRTFTIPNSVYNMLYRYTKANNIKPNEKLFDMTIRNVQAKLASVVDYLGYKHISSHSFRKMFASQCYAMTKDIEVVRRILQHSSASITLRYIGIADEKIERTLRKVANIVAVEGQPLKGLPDKQKEPPVAEIDNAIIDAIISAGRPYNLSAEQSLKKAAEVVSARLSCI